MKDRARSKFINLWPTNKTQNMYSRAIKTPQTGLDSEFSKSKREWAKAARIKNPFSGGYKDD